jgi:NAD(P)-dependent dehydrogenase (short-subunit alcohol dehydrogenase family)
MPNTTCDRVVLVTGGGTGVGRAVAQRFATEGAFVYLAGRRDHQLEETAEAITARGGRCRALPTDITVREEVDSLLRSVREQHGFLDVLVTAANVFRMGLVHEMPDEDFDLIFNTNIRGLWMVSKLAIPLMLGRTNANIIHISSSGATRTDPGVGLFEASKAAVNTLTKVMAKELATQKIRVNAIAPGPLESSFFRGNVLGEDRGGHGSHPALVASVPFGRIGTPEEVARLAVFLASPESDFISGSVTAIDGALGY